MVGVAPPHPPVISFSEKNAEKTESFSAIKNRFKYSQNIWKYKGL